MKLIFVFLVTICGFFYVDGYITYIEAKFPLQGTVAPPGAPWPIPKKMDSSDQQRTLDPNFQISSNVASCDVITDAISRYQRLILLPKAGKHSSFPVITKVNVQIENNDCGNPNSAMKESYKLEVKNSETVEIKADTIWGALRGLETFSQLVYVDETTNNYLINQTSIEDEPQYSYRGILMDTARHFLPMNILKMNLDAMSYNKFNVFHWHLVDDQSWPFESKVFPNLTKIAAYSPYHVYRQQDIIEIINYARLRGIRVIPEIDSPGHTQAIGKVFKDILTVCYKDGKPNVAVYGKHAEAEILDPTKNITYDIFKQIFQEVKDLFPDEYIHLGMDEAYGDCWLSNPDVLDFMKEHEMGQDTEKLQEYYVEKTLNNVKDIGYKYIIWQEPVEKGGKVANDSIIEIWKDKSLVDSFDPWQNYMKKIAPKGYDMIVSACWYLNYMFEPHNANWMGLYACDPRNFSGTPEEKSRVLGGEACMWGEYNDGTNVLSKLWPRASAAAEKLWSPLEHTNDPESAKFRLDQQRCRMLRRGVPTQPILNGYCGNYEWDMQIPSVRGSASRFFISGLLLICTLLTKIILNF